jgi:hypothetical protein
VKGSTQLVIASARRRSHFGAHLCERIHRNNSKRDANDDSAPEPRTVIGPARLGSLWRFLLLEVQYNEESYVNDDVDNDVSREDVSRDVKHVLKYVTNPIKHAAETTATFALSVGLIAC